MLRFLPHIGHTLRLSGSLRRCVNNLQNGKCGVQILCLFEKLNRVYMWNRNRSEWLQSGWNLIWKSPKMSSSSYFWANLGKTFHFYNNQNLWIVPFLKEFSKKLASGVRSTPRTIKSTFKKFLFSCYSLSIIIYTNSHRRPTWISKHLFQVYRFCTISFCTWHTFTECFLICYDLNSLSLEELTVSIAYSIQHFLGIVKVYIM